MTQLYKLADQYKELEAMDIDPQAVADTLESIECDIKDKAQNIGFVNANWDSQIGVIDAEVKRLQAMKKVITNKQTALKDYLRTNMERLGMKKIECDLFSITLRKPVDVVVIDDDQEVPRDYWKVVESVDKAKVKQALKDGYSVKGARLAPGKSGLMIK
jgi:hypothetical protein